MKNPFKWAADHLKRLFGHTPSPNLKPKAKPGKMRWFPHGALYQFLAQLDYGAQARKEAKLSKPQKARKEFRERTTTQAMPIPKRQPGQIEALAIQAADKSKEINRGRPRHKQYPIGGHKWRKRIARSLRAGTDRTHQQLTNMGIARHKDGNRLGLRKRIELAGLQNAFLTSGGE